MNPFRIVGFLSDYGLRDEWVAACKGVLFTGNPQATIIDISHGIPPFDIKKGAFVLAAALPYMPQGIYLAIVDPGVGSVRRAILIETIRQDFLIGPDNGLLLPAAKRLSGIKRVFDISNHPFSRKPVHPTFHGRDIFAPAAAYLSSGGRVSNLGKSIDPRSLAGAPWGDPVFDGPVVSSEIIDVERFGNCRLNLTREALEQAGAVLVSGSRLEIKFGDRHFFNTTLKETFSDAPVNEPLIYWDSSGFLALALNQGDFAHTFGLASGDSVQLTIL